MIVPNIHPNWKWFFEAPLSRAWRQRLELCLGVVLGGAAAVALSSTVRPDPARVAVLRGTPVVMSSPPPENYKAQQTPPSPPPRSNELVEAIRSGNVGAMNRAYARGVPMEGMLGMAARSGKKEAVLWVLAHGGSIHDEEYSPLSPILAADDKPEIVTLLRERGAAEPSLAAAAAALAPNAVRRALVANPSARVNEALATATHSYLGPAKNKQIVVRQLLDAGADPSSTIVTATALGGAVESCNNYMVDESEASSCMGAVRLLLDRGAQVKGDALGAALSLGDAHRQEPLDALLDRPLEPGVTANALAEATSVEAKDLERVVARGVDWAWHDGENDAAIPLLAAVRRGNRDLVRAYLDAGAPVDVHFKDASSALAVAIDGSADNSEFARIVELLVTRGANVNRRFPDGRTPLFAAAEAGDIRVVNFLLARGARVNDVVLFDTALDVATQRDNIAAARILHAHGAHTAHSSQGCAY